MPTYTHNPYWTQYQPILLVAILCMLAPIWRNSRIVVVKKHKIYKTVTLGCYKKIWTITHKFWYQPFSSLPSCFICWMSSIFFLQEKTWNILYNSKLFVYMYKFNHDYMHLKHIVVEMTPPMMQLCPFLWPSHSALF